MPYFLNPFKKHDVSEFPGVLIPLEQAHRPVSASSDAENKKVSSDGASAIEKLRAEVEADLSAGGHDTAYDSM